MSQSPRLARVAVMVCAALVIAGCTQPGVDGYLVVAEFPQAVSLFEQSRVKVMGIDVGHVREVTIVGDRIRVEMLIDRDVPLPDDVVAAIVPLSLIGERNVMLSPSWQPGDTELVEGTVLGLDRTRVPVEADDALRAFTDLADAVDPVAVEQLLTNAADALDGQGQRINDVLVRAADLTSTLTEQDDELIELATALGDLAGTLDSRDVQLGELLSTYADAVEVLADERDDVERFVGALADLSASGNSLLDTYEESLPEDLASLAQLLIVLQTDIGALQDFATAIPTVVDAVFDAYRPADSGLQLRFNGEQFADLAGLLGLTGGAP